MRAGVPFLSFSESNPRLSFLRTRIRVRFLYQESPELHFEPGFQALHVQDDQSPILRVLIFWKSDESNDMGKEGRDQGHGLRKHWSEPQKQTPW